LKGISRSTLYTLELVRRNLEEKTLDFHDPIALTWLCEQLRDVVYDVHEELLKQRDEVKAIQVFENLYLPFDRMAKFFEKMAKKEASE